jgi:hypothetical protein
MSSRVSLLQPASNPLTQRVLQGAGRAVLHVGQHVGICVQGDSYGGVPQHSETILGLTLLPSKRVAHVCPRSWGRMAGSPAFARSEGPLPEVAGVQGGAPLRGEDEADVLIEGAQAVFSSKWLERCARIKAERDDKFHERREMFGAT